MRLDTGRGAEDVDGALPRLQEARDDFEERALAAAVRAEDRRQLPAVELDVHVADRRATVVPGGHAAKLDRHRADDDARVCDRRGTHRGRVPELRRPVYRSAFTSWSASQSMTASYEVTGGSPRVSS